MGVVSHACVHFQAQVKEVLLGNSAIADAKIVGFEREETGFGSNLRPLKTQLLVATMGALKPTVVTGSRGRRRRDVGWAPLWPAQSVRNMHTDQDG